MDALGNAIVTGSTYDEPTVDSYDADIYTAMYAAADGALLWERRYNGPTHGDDRPMDLAVDTRGNIVVTGISSFDNRYNIDYYTASYAAADGAVLWEKYYNGPANGLDSPGGSHSLAVGPNGMVAITGMSDGAFDFFSYASDYATVVYRELPPPLSCAHWVACFDLSNDAAAADADPDFDGLPNAAEYVLSGNPAVPDTAGRPAFTLSGGDIIFTFPRDDASETPDVTLTVETGADLVTWPTVFIIGPTTTDSSHGVSVTENGSGLDTITVTIPQGTGTRLFARLKVTIAQ